MTDSAREIESIGAALAEARACLRAAGVKTAELDARVLAAAAFGMGAEELIRRETESPPEGRLSRLRAHVARRVKGEPVAYIIGHREFWSLNFAVRPGCLVPRPDSESMVEAVLAHAGEREGERRVLDLGTGTGCLLLALLSEWRDAKGVGIDADPRAVRTARENADALGLGGRAWFLVGDWAASISASFEVIVANPPYIPSADIDALSRDVREFEPREALDGGSDGLESIRVILEQVRRILAPRGIFALEFGPGQGRQIECLAREHGGLAPLTPVTDLNGCERGILFQAEGS